MTVKPVSEELPEPVQTGLEGEGNNESVVIEKVSREHSEVVATIDMHSPEMYRALAEQGITVKDEPIVFVNDPSDNEDEKAPTGKKFKRRGPLWNRKVGKTVSLEG